MTPQEIQAHAAEAQAKYNAMNAPAALSPAPDPFATAQADGSLPPAASVTAPAPVAQSDVPPPIVAPVQDGSQEPLHVTTAAPGQRVQTASAFNVGPPSITPREVAAHGEAAGEVNAQELQAAHDNRVKAVNEQAKVDEDIANAQAPIEDDRRDVLGAQALDEQAQMQEDAANAKKHFDTLMGYNKEIQDHVANQPTDLWGRAGVNKVAGIIGLVLGGLGGGATGGKNMAVDTLNALVEQNLKQNEYKYEMLKGKVTTENQAYAQVRATSQDKQQAADRFRLISLEQYKQQMQQAAAQFAGPQAKARADAALGQIDTETAQLHEKMLAESNQTFAAAGQMALAERGQNLQSIQINDARAAANQKQSDEQYLPEYVMPEGKHIPASEAEKLRQAQGGASNVQTVMSEMRKQAAVGGWKSVVENKALQADLMQALIKQRQLSNRVSKDEGALLHDSIGFLNAGNLAGFLQLFGAKSVEEGLSKAQSRFAKSWDTNIQKGYGYKPTETNPFVKAANGDFSSWDEEDNQVAGAVSSNDPIASIPTRAQVQQQARAARQRMTTPAYAGGY